MILCEFTYYETVFQYNEGNVTNLKSLLITNSSGFAYSQIEVKRIKSPSWIEYLLIFWMIAFMMEELRQVN